MKFFTTFLFALFCAATVAAQTTSTKPASTDLIEATEKSKTGSFGIRHLPIADCRLTETGHPIGNQKWAIGNVNPLAM